jgi:RND superfamily putative drug exporter
VVGFGVFGQLLSNGFDPASAQANALMDQHFGGSPDMIFVVHARAGTVDSPAAAAAGTQLAGKLGADPRLTGVTSAMEHPHRDRHQTGGPRRKAAPQEGDQ